MSEIASSSTDLDLISLFLQAILDIHVRCGLRLSAWHLVVVVELEHGFELRRMTADFTEWLRHAGLRQVAGTASCR